MFSLKNLKQASGWIFLVVGIVAYLLGYAFIEDSTYREVSIKVGDVLVIGVVIGYLSNITQSFGLFKEELYSVIYAKDFLEKRKDISDLWDIVSKVVLKNKFPTIHKELLYVVNSYLPTEDVSYYNDYVIQTSITWEDKEKGLIRCTDNISFELIAECSDRFDYPFKTWSTLSRDSERTEEIKDFSVNGSIYEIGESIEEIDSDGNICIMRNVVLEGSGKYSIKYTREKTYSIKEDYYFVVSKPKCKN